MGSFLPIRIGLIIGLCGMLLVLYGNSSYVCLVGYALMGLGLAPVVPTLFSLAGSIPGVTPQRASSMVAFLAYGGLLFVPPSIGYLAQIGTLHSALFSCCSILGGYLFGFVVPQGYLYESRRKRLAIPFSKA